MNNKKQFHIGTSGWTYDHWKGTFYPPDIPKTKWFEYYTTLFSTVEINATFYRFFKDQTYYKWRDTSPDDFVYVLKAPKLITHRKYLLEAEREIKEFYRSVSLLEEKFGLVLLQLAPQTPYDPERLYKALHAFSNPSKIAVEFRHTQLHEVGDLCSKMAAQGAKTVYIFFNNDFGGFAPKNALRLKEIVGVK
jgi:uncharacterized protein YecE (DUF72 family)